MNKKGKVEKTNSVLTNLQSTPKRVSLKNAKGNLFNFYHIYLSCHKYVKSRDDMPKKNWFNK